MSDVSFEVGGSAAPFMSVMDQVKANAKESASKVTEAFGIEGLKGERALHTRFLGAFKDITKGGQSSAEAIGGAFENLTEGLRLSLGSMIALLALSELVKGLYSGYEAAEKMRSSLKDALSVNTDISKQSVQQVQENIKKLNEDAQANNLASMSSLQAGATVFVEALEEGKTISQVVREDAENYNRIKQEAHDMEDAAAARTIDNENAVLALRAEGHDKEADALAHEQEMQEKILNAQAKGNQNTIDALNQQMALEQQITDRKEAAEAKSKAEKVSSLQAELSEEVKRTSDVGATEEQKLKEAQDARQKAADIWTANTNPDGSEKTDEDNLKQEITLQKAITAEKEAQHAVDLKHYREFAEWNEKGAEQAKRAREQAEQRVRLTQEEQEAQRAVNEARLGNSIWHGEASSSARVGLGGRVTGANYGNEAQLRAVQDSAKHLADIKASIQKLAQAVGVAPSG